MYIYIYIFSDDDPYKEIVLGILYHLSIDDKVKSMFTYTDCIGIVSLFVISSIVHQYINLIYYSSNVDEI